MARLTDIDSLLEKVTKLVANGGNTAETVGKIIIAITDAPIVDAVEVVHGRWEESHEIKAFRGTNIPVVRCSKCEVYFCDLINNHHYMYHYCPNCGAKMGGDGNV